MSNETQHTPRPWRLNGDVIDGPDHTPLACRGEYAPDVRMKRDNWRANARRIVAAVNAVEGIPVEALEAGVVSDLLEAAEKGLSDLENNCAVGEGLAGRKALQHAIAKARRETP